MLLSKFNGIDFQGGDCITPVTEEMKVGGVRVLLLKFNGIDFQGGYCITPFIEEMQLDGVRVLLLKFNGIVFQGGYCITPFTVEMKLSINEKKYEKIHNFQERERCSWGTAIIEVVRKVKSSSWIRRSLCSLVGSDKRTP